MKSLLIFLHFLGCLADEKLLIKNGSSWEVTVKFSHWFNRDSTKFLQNHEFKILGGETGTLHYWPEELELTARGKSFFKSDKIDKNVQTYLVRFNNKPNLRGFFLEVEEIKIIKRFGN